MLLLLEGIRKHPLDVIFDLVQSDMYFYSIGIFFTSRIPCLHRFFFELSLQDFDYKLYSNLDFLLRFEAPYLL